VGVVSHTNDTAKAKQLYLQHRQHKGSCLAAAGLGARNTVLAYPKKKEI
jgi:hypothetical protein